MPRVWSSLPHVRLRVVAGPGYERYWHEFERNGGPGGLDLRIEIHGFVEDLRPLYARASMVAVPLEVSAGTNIKVLEAMACGKAIVSTPAGIQGLDLSPGVDVLVAGSAPEMARAIAELFENTEKRDAVGPQARATVVRRYDWNVIAAGQHRLYETLCAV